MIKTLNNEGLMAIGEGVNQGQSGIVYLKDHLRNVLDGLKSSMLECAREDLPEIRGGAKVINAVLMQINSAEQYRETRAARDEERRSIGNKGLV
jgi:hypothetical protein